MKNNVLLSLFMALIFASCSKTEEPFIAADQQSESGSSRLYKKDNAKEIKGKLTFNFTTNFDLSCSDCEEGYSSTGNYYGGGNLSHLGSVTSKTKACCRPILSSEFNFIGVHIGSQCCSFVAPNGDELYLTNDPYDLYMNSSGIAVGTCKFYFAGGKGKYQNARGSFNGYVENNLRGNFTVGITGTLAY